MLVAYHLIILLASFIDYKILDRLWLSGLADGLLDVIMTTWLGILKLAALLNLTDLVKSFFI